MIKNGSNILLNQNAGTLPDVSSAMHGWFKKMTFYRVTKTIIDFELVENSEAFDFLGVWQPLSARQIAYKPEGQRAWKWFQVHAEPSLALIPDEVISYQGTQYRVKGVSNYDEYGYTKYDLIEDFTGSGPTVTV
jgi:hypothetical protein